MSNVIITSETLYELLRMEKSRKELQKLDEQFFKNVTKYLEEKKAILSSQEKKDSIFASQEIKKTRKELENIQKMLKELYEKRESKIITLAIFSTRTKSKVQDSSIMLKEEQDLYNSLLTQLTQFRKGILENLMKGKEPLIEIKGHRIEEEKNLTVKFKEAVPQFMGTDLKRYGPFEQEDIASMPKNIAELLIKRGRAETL